MKKVVAWAAGLLIAMAGAMAHAAGEKGTTQEAQALVKKAIAYYDKNGKDKTIGELVKTPGPFVDRDLYVTIYNMQGDCLAHINPKMVNKNLMEMRDSGGTYIVRDRTAAAQKEASGWQDITFFNPVTKKVEPKRVYWEKHDNLIFAAGAYKPA
jgi:signal transduction histidine kinase